VSGCHLEFLRHFGVLFLKIHTFSLLWSRLPKYVIRSTPYSALDGLLRRNILSRDKKLVLSLIQLLVKRPQSYSLKKKED
jgi:hypothetical protein